MCITNFKMYRTEQITIHTRVTIMLIVFNIVIHVTGVSEKKNGLIYILIWTSGNDEPFNVIEMGQIDFKNCAFKNCFLTGDRNYFRNILDFDVLLFDNIRLRVGMDLPANRSSTQKYCMYGIEPAVYHYMSEDFNGFFNITFTYKLSSNITLPYVVVKDENGEIIGPQIDMRWKKVSEMNETSDYVKNKLGNKKIAAAWIVSHCETPFRRIYAHALQEELAELGHSLDVYGRCGTKQCPKGEYGQCGSSKCPLYERMEECLAFIESDYYFYLSFENSFSEDYVTEKLLHALEHFAVPVVYGGANYSRYMPEGIYLDASVLEPNKMAARMNEIIEDKNKYYEFFKWHEHYSFHFSGEDRYVGEICKLCAFINNNINQTSTYENITDWWNEIQAPWPTSPNKQETESEEPESETEDPSLEKSDAERFFFDLLHIFDPSWD